MELNRKIALLILVGLLMGLFGSFSFLIGIEPLLIKDRNGALLNLNQSQKNALGQCKILKYITADCDSQTIDFEGIPAPVIKEDLEHLAGVIHDPKQIAAIPKDRIISIFKLADYLHAPKELSAELAEQVEDLINPRIAFLEKLRESGKQLDESQEAEFSELQRLWESLQKYQGISMRKFIQAKGLTNSSEGHIIVDLSAEKNAKNKFKLKRLHGIEKLTGAHLVRELHLDNHNLTSINLASLKKIFPHLYRLSLKNNRIEEIYLTQPVNKMVVEIEGNPLQSITIKNPQKSNYLKFRTDNPDLKVEFIQTKHQKIHTWLKSLTAKTKIIRNCYLPPNEWLLLFAGIGVGYKILENICIDLFIFPEWKREWAIRNLNLQESLLKMYQSSMDSLKTLHHLDSDYISELISYYAEAIEETTVKINSLNQSMRPNMPLPILQKWFLSPAKAGVLTCGLFTAALAIGYFINNYGNYLTLADFFLNRHVQRNPYRIKIECNDQVIKTFPSNYTYNLFRKM